MPTIPVGYTNFTVVMRGPGATKNSTWSFGSDAGTTTTISTLCENVHDALTDAGSICDPPNMLAGWQLLGVDGTFMDDTGPFLGSFSQTITGTKTGGPLPVNCAFLVTKGTARGGRKGRGRIFLPPTLIGDIQVDGQGFIDSGAMSTLQAEFDVLLASLIANSVPPFLLHAGAEVPDAITALTLQQQVATQRRRMR